MDNIIGDMLSPCLHLMALEQVSLSCEPFILPSECIQIAKTLHNNTGAQENGPKQNSKQNVQLLETWGQCLVYSLSQKIFLSPTANALHNIASFFLSPQRFTEMSSFVSNGNRSSHQISFVT